ncbi:MAG TPA: protein-glutamine glutaminase family protein [Bacteriovoracaceae bacterium]|nr:protein-glutamine glutaminase family protein [Bacteriovoracaceae bacterium]
MKSSFIYLFCLFFVAEALAYDPDSAVRDLDADYTVYEEKAAGHTIRNTTTRTSALGSARLYDPAKLPAATKWKSLQAMQLRFEFIRDTRFLEWNRNGSFPRRSSWLYPDDGCYARAALANRNLFRLFVPIPSKVFAFGNLRVKTSNNPRGKVGWWYHVAPIVQVDGVKFVLDPAIEPQRPLELSEWLSRMGTPQKIKVSICSSGAYAPRGDCLNETDGLEKRAENAQRHFLELEWKRLVKLGRTAEVQLGEHPPWMNTTN